MQFHLHAARAKDFVCGTDIKFHIGYIELAFVIVFYFADLRLPEFPHFLFFGVGAILLCGHHIGGSNIHIAHASTQYVATCQWVIFYGRIDILWVLQVETAGHTIQIIVVIHAYSFYLHRRHNGSIQHHCQAIFLRHCQRPMAYSP